MAEGRAGLEAGYWESPEADAMIAGRDITLRGWVRSDSRHPSRVVVLRDGVPVAETAVPGRTGGPGHRGQPARAAWEVSLTSTDGDAGATIEVAVFDRRSRTSLGTGRLRAVGRGPAEVTAGTGWVDEPRPGGTVTAGRAMTLEGWVLFDGQPAESVDLLIGEEPPVPVRNNVPRFDVWDVVSSRPSADPRSIAAGFADLIPIPAAWAGRDLKIVVRGRSLDGQVWTSDPVAVRVVPEPSHPDEFDLGSPFLHEADLGAGRAPVPVAGRTGEPRVCVFTHSLRLGGGELYLQELALRLVRHHGCRVLIVAPEDGPLKEELRAAGVPVHLTRQYALDPVHYLGGVAELRTLLAAWAAHAVIVNTLGVFPGVDAALQAGLPVIWAIHESFPLETFAFLHWGTQGVHPAVRERWLHCLASASTTFESQATLELFQRQVPGLRGSVVHYGVDLPGIGVYQAERDRTEVRARLGFSPDDVVFLCIGVVQERKAQLPLVWAFGEVARSHPGARLVLVGDHPSAYSRAVRDLVERLGMGDRISIEPIQPDSYQWYLAADVVVSASDTESLPRSVLEAMAFGRPVLAADVFGLSEVIRDGVNGWLCRPRSCSALVAGLKEVLTLDPSDLRAMSERCRSDAQGFDGAGYAAAYASMIRGGSPSGYRADQGTNLRGR